MRDCMAVRWRIRIAELDRLACPRPLLRADLSPVGEPFPGSAIKGRPTPKAAHAPPYRLLGDVGKIHPFQAYPEKSSGWEKKLLAIPDRSSYIRDVG